MKKAGKAVLKRVPVAGKEVLAVKIISLTRKAGEGVPRSGKVVPETVNRVLLIRKAVLERVNGALVVGKAVLASRKARKGVPWSVNKVPLTGKVKAVPETVIIVQQARTAFPTIN